MERLNEANRIVAKLDPAIRADAFALMEPYVAGTESKAPDGPARRSKSPRSAKTEAVNESTARKASPGKAPTRKASVVVPPIEEDEEHMVEAHLSDNDSENVLLALAIFLKRHGRGPFEMAHLRAIAQQLSLNISARPDKFLEQASRGEPKRLLARKQADGWRVMPSGADWIKETYGVAMGRVPLPIGH